MYLAAKCLVDKRYTTDWHDEQRSYWNVKSVRLTTIENGKKIVYVRVRRLARPIMVVTSHSYVVTSLHNISCSCHDRPRFALIIAPAWQLLTKRFAGYILKNTTAGYIGTCIFACRDAWCTSHAAGMLVGPRCWKCMHAACLVHWCT